MRLRLFDEMKRIKHSSALMQLKRLVLIGVALCPAICAEAQQAQPAAQQPASQQQVRKTRVLSLEECIALALRNNLDIQIQRYNPVINQYALDITYSGYEPIASFAASKSYNDRPGGFNPQTGLPFPANLTEANSYTPDIKGVLPTGLTYDLNGNWSRNSQRATNTPGFWLPPTWSSDPSITLSQPLLKNFWIDSTRLQIQLNKATLKISEQALRLQIMTTVTSVESAYYTLLFARGNVEANATALKLAQQLVAENVKRVEVGALAPLDEKQSESQSAASLASLEVAQHTLVTQENTLKILLTDNYAEWADVTMIPSEELVAVPKLDLNLQESWRRAVVERPELIEAKLNVEKQNVTLKFDYNQIFPQLDLTGTYGRNAFNNSFSSNLGDLRTGSSSFYSYGAVFSMPLGDTGPRDAYKSAKVTLKQLLTQLKQTEQNILVQVDNDVGQVRSTFQQVESTRAARVYAEEALAAERKKLENGKSTSFIVLQLISNLTSARVLEIQALANYNIAIAQLSLDEGSTLQEKHIDLKIK
ncbi:MAG: Outer rane efflux protein [Pedosphaera sp.]|nr:Outer rane efflux protein [Pedosphaera sp.]